MVRLLELVPIDLRPLELLGSCGSGTSIGLQPKEATSRRRPSATFLPSPGSARSVKYWKGVLAAHSSPWKSRGVNGVVRSSADAAFNLPSSPTAERRSPAARFP